MYEVIMKDWREFRKQGRRAYVIKHGVLLWGLSSAVIWALVMQYFDPSDPVWLRPLIAAAVFPAVGYFVGLWTWRKKEAKYHQEDGAGRS
ncbi:MAG: hypothetical protein CMP07_12075 [Xanthomonadales bacterium]|nr:hypothetical protein [Xanthomonadales bacterium]|tara:strand:- start:305 stop:574 length:270 start_codon:yes stop_codon:yes gene_type:complete